jgi:lipid II:glycine glycyltransferase (peptidoglycan interpeptide bridge formation enzyme)
LTDEFAVRVTTEAPPDWDAWVLERGAEGGFCQSSAWAEVARQANGDRVWFVTVTSADDVVARALVTQPRPPGRRALLPRTVWPVRCIDGPVLATRADHRAVDRLSAILAHLGGRRGGAGVLIQPAPRSRLLAAYADRLAAAGFVIEPRPTSIVELRDSEAQWAALPHAIRKNVKRCQREGVDILECNDVEAYVRHFAPAYRAARAAAGNPIPHWLHDEQMVGTAPQHYTFFVAHHEGEALGTLGTYRWGDLVTEIASSRTPTAGSLPVQDLLHWHVFEHHANAGAQCFDMAGFEAEPASPKEAGIRRFKEKWGGETVDSGRWVRPPGDPIARSIRRLRR